MHLPKLTAVLESGEKNKAASALSKHEMTRGDFFFVAGGSCLLDIVIYSLGLRL